MTKKNTNKSKVEADCQFDGKSWKFTQNSWYGLHGKLWTKEEAMQNPAEMERLTTEGCSVVEEVK